MKKHIGKLINLIAPLSLPILGLLVGILASSFEYRALDKENLEFILFVWGLYIALTGFIIGFIFLILEVFIPKKRNIVLSIHCLVLFVYVCISAYTISGAMEI